MIEASRAIEFSSGYSYVLIYVFEINDNLHRGCVKVGKATIKTTTSLDKLQPNCSELNKAARIRIDSYTRTASIQYNLLHTELAVWNNPKHDQKLEYFLDTDVHKVLINSGIEKAKLGENSGAEWFYTNVETVKNAIQCVKKNQKVLSGVQIVKQVESIVFRPEQEEAIKSTVKKFKNKGLKMLWNAKMRFGKTLSALEVIRQLGCKKSIIITHRPVVNKSWKDDFTKIFGTSKYKYCSRTEVDSEDKTSTSLISCLNGVEPFIYFASIQDLRGSKRVGGKFDKNNEVFDTQWDMVIVDEAHEGTQTSLGDNVIKNIIKEKTKAIFLSGTPFNIINDFDESETYTWDYIMEQKAKAEWDMNHFGDSNPYEGLPQLNIYTYDIADAFPGYEDIEDKAFNFREFFRVWTGRLRDDGRALPTAKSVGKFVHEEDVRQFLKRLSEEGAKSNYPFSEKRFQEYFNHSLWMVPGVKEAKALKELLEEPNSPFSLFTIVNVAGEEESQDGKKYKSALEKLNTAIGKRPEETYTITLSCGRLTTGVSVPAWTAVLMLSGNAYSKATGKGTTSASLYLQTIFRVQTPANINGKIKDRCYVFDFAPDRMLSMVSAAGKLGTRPGSRDEKSEHKMREFLNYCPVISIKGSEMRTYDVDAMLRQLKKYYAVRVAQNGFDDIKLYNDSLLKLTDLDVKKFEELKRIIGETKASDIKKTIEINKSELGDEELEELEKTQKERKKKGAELTPEQKEQLEKLKKAREEKAKAISILRSISIRIPLMVYGSQKSFDEDINIENFAEMIDEISWEEFMPKGITKNIFNDFIQYFDKDIFIEAGNQIRRKVRASDELSPTERVKKLVEIFNTFKNPDKETVLTPWRVVNMHLSKTLGGYDFFNEEHEDTIEKPRFVDNGDISRKTVSNIKTKILEINSKSGLYPLYITYSLYRARLEKDESEYKIEELNRYWDDVVKENIFVVCKTPMAKAITKRTLLGYRAGKCNAHSFDDLVNQFKNKSDSVVKKINTPSYWGIKGINEMKFDAVIGNPPYQETLINSSDQPVYHYFYDVAFKLSSLSTLITPARFLFKAGKTPKDWNEKMLNDEHFKVVQYFQVSDAVFPRTDIKGGVCITLHDLNKSYGKIGLFSNYTELNSIANKVLQTKDFKSLKDLVFAPESYRLTKKLHETYPDVKNLLSDGHLFDLTTNIFEKLNKYFFDERPNDGKEYVKIYGRCKNERVFKWIQKAFIENHENLYKWKVFVPKSNGSGAIGEVLSTPIIGEPIIGHTQTFISIGKFETQFEAIALLKYVKSKFARTLLGTLKATQDNKKETWANVPMQNFSEKSDIDWTKSIKEIDVQLYEKYNLEEKEIEFIEKMIRAMV